MNLKKWLDIPTGNTDLEILLPNPCWKVECCTVCTRTEYPSNITGILVRNNRNNLFSFTALFMV